MLVQMRKKVCICEKVQSQLVFFGILADMAFREGLQNRRLREKLLEEISKPLPIILYSFQRISALFHATRLARQSQ